MKVFTLVSLLVSLVTSTLLGQVATGFIMPSPNPPVEPYNPWLELPEQKADVPKAPLATPSTEWTFHTTADGSRPDGNEQQMT